MSRWVEQFKNHPFNVELSRLGELLIAQIPDEKIVSVEILQEYARLRKAVEYVRGVVESLDPELLPNHLLPNLNTFVLQIIDGVNSFAMSQNVAHLQSANNAADNLISQAAQLPLSISGSVKSNLTKAVTSYSEVFDRHAKSYVKLINELVSLSKSHLLEVDEQMEAAIEKIDKIESRADNVDAVVQSQLSSFNQTFQGSESSRASAFDLWLSKFQEKSENDYANLAKQNAAGLSAMLSFQDDAKRVLGTVIDTAQAGAYAKYANEEGGTANWYRRFAIFSMLSASLVMFVPEIFHLLKQGMDYSVDWEKALYRLPFSLILFAPALYLAKESGKHRANEVVSRRRQHILTTIGPYLAFLPKEKADEIKADVAKNVFSENLNFSEEKMPDAGSLAALSQLLSLIKR